jgi:amino acid adenylation domain-containing protein
MEMVAGLLGIIKSGAAYLPLDPSYPAARISYILGDAEPLAVLVNKRFVDHEGLSSCAATIALEDTFDRQQCSAPPDIQSSPWDVAYVIYTSGSTGTPKGVMIPHRGICNRLLWMQKEFVLTGTDRILQKTPFTFDVSVWEFFWPLITGAAIVMARPDGHKDATYIAETIQSQKVTLVHFVPSMLNLFNEEPKAGDCGGLRYVICSGEALTKPQTDRFFERMPAGVRLYNLYGPTEASVDVSFWECTRGDSHPNVPIGRPIANTQLFVLDAGMQPAPVGVIGGLYIGGVGLAREYLNRNALTMERFPRSPFFREFPDMDERIYKTGDLARWLDDGVLDYCGRSDFQVKIRGNRIELGEIEHVLLQHQLVRACIVTVFYGSSTNPRLVAYVIPKSQHLPGYMVPSMVIVMDGFPLTSSGKIDRKALPNPEQACRDVDTIYCAPSTDSEKMIGICGVIFCMLTG